MKGHKFLNGQKRVLVSYFDMLEKHHVILPERKKNAIFCKLKEKPLILKTYLSFLIIAGYY